MCDTEQWEYDEQKAMEDEIEKLRGKNQNLFNALMEATAKSDELHATIEQQRMGLDNCRLLAARHRKEDWALLILGFCAEAGIVGSVMR